MRDRNFPNQDDMSDAAELDEILRCIVDYKDTEQAIIEAKAQLLKWSKRREVAAQTNAVAWAVDIIDQLHISLIDSSKYDKEYKVIKNAIRENYKMVVGVDPALAYPIKATLKQQEDEL